MIKGPVWHNIFIKKKAIHRNICNATVLAGPNYFQAHGLHPGLNLILVPRTKKPGTGSQAVPKCAFTSSLSFRLLWDSPLHNS